MLPIKLAQKSQQYNPSLPSQSLTTTGNIQTLMGLENIKLDRTKLKKIIKDFRLFVYCAGYRPFNLPFVIDYACQILISLIQQHIPGIVSEEQDKDIGNVIDCYKLNIDYTNILIEHYIRMVGYCKIGNCEYYSGFDDSLADVYSTDIENPMGQIDDDYKKYLGLINIYICFIICNIELNKYIIDMKVFVPLFKIILIKISNLPLHGYKSVIYVLIQTLKTVSKLLPVYDKKFFLWFVDYFTDYMLDRFINIYIPTTMT